MAERWDRSAPKASAMIREGLQDCLAVLQFPEEHQIRLTSTNLLENLMRRLKKRSAVVGVFPNRSSCDRLLGAQLIEVHEDWQTNPRGNMNMNMRREAEQSPGTAAA